MLLPFQIVSFWLFFSYFHENSKGYYLSKLSVFQPTWLIFDKSKAYILFKNDRSIWSLKNDRSKKLRLLLKRKWSHTKMIAGLQNCLDYFLNQNDREYDRTLKWSLLNSKTLAWNDRWNSFKIAQIKVFWQDRKGYYLSKLSWFGCFSAIFMKILKATIFRKSFKIGFLNKIAKATTGVY